jgi:hypothetical protein
MKRLAWTISGVLIAVITCASTLHIWQPFSAIPPRIEYPASLDLGPGETGVVVACPVHVKNSGDSDLHVDEIRTNCSCTGLEKLVDGKHVRVESLTIKPGETSELWIRVTVRGVPVGTKMNNVIQFRTNDPTHIQGQMVAFVPHVSGGVQVRPKEFFLGTVPQGSEARHTAEIWDDAAETRKIVDVVSSQPQRIAVRRLSLEAADSAPAKQAAGQRVGRFEFNVNTTKTGEFYETIEIQVEGRAPDTMIVSGRVAAPVELAPALLVLPRQSESGLVYSALCVCSADKSVNLTVESCPLGLNAKILPSATTGTKMIEVSWIDAKLPEPSQLPSVIRFRAIVQDREFAVELPVWFRE